jgi:hypothetical protein
MLKNKAIVALGFVAGGFALLGAIEGEPGAAPGPADAVAAPADIGVGFVRWKHPQGLFSMDVPAGWRIDGRIGAALDQGQFLIEGRSPDGSAMFAIAHNWQSFMEFQYGRYRPGTATLESLILPQLPQHNPGIRQLRVAYRSANQRVALRTPGTGLPIQIDKGLVGLLGYGASGRMIAGSALGETLYIPVPGTPGLWRLRLFVAGIAPAEAQRQVEIQAVQRRAFDSLQLSPEFMRTWQEGAAQSAKAMREYSRDMDRIFSRYLVSAGRSSSGRRDPLQGWSEMMRGGHYETDPSTGSQHLVANDQRYWFKNDQGEIRGNDTGDVPAPQDNWRLLTR